MMQYNWVTLLTRSSWLDEAEREAKNRNANWKAVERMYYHIGQRNLKTINGTPQEPKGAQMVPDDEMVPAAEAFPAEEIPCSNHS
jgi:hypothetical protein